MKAGLLLKTALFLVFWLSCGAGFVSLTAQELPASEGISDHFPFYPEEILPGTKPERVIYPHLKKGNQSKQIKSNKQNEPDKNGNKTGNKKEDEGKGIWATLRDFLGSDKTLINVVVLVILVAIFTVYRIRAGKSRRRMP